MLPMTDSETAVDAALRETIEQDGVHVVHVWAPWCDNSLAELAPVWAPFSERHPDVSVSFATVWNDGASGTNVLRQHGVVGVAEHVVPGPKPEKADRRMTLLGLPVTWIPTTWVFNRGGLLATAFNYGEASADGLAAAIEGAQNDWSH